MHLMSMRARGMRDVLPEDEIIYRRIVGVIENSYIKYGFDPVSHPAIERLDVLEAKSGEGIKTEIFRMDDNELGLRFDLTVSLARMVAEHSEFPYPFKRYCIEKVWRREEPQYGRYREFMQADADIVGCAGMECEAELIACACDVLDEIGIRDYRVLINNRKLLTAVLEHVGVEKEKVESAIRIVDKLDKKDRNDVVKELEENGIKNGDEIVDAFNKDMAYYEQIDGCAEGVKELKELLSLLEVYGIKNYRFEPSIARGLGYYTGTVYEIKSADAQLGTIVAGGRYDKLIGIYSERDVPAVGISFGIDRIATLLKKEDKRKTYTQIVVVNVKESNKPACIAYARELRKNGIATRVDLMGRNMRKQLDYASSIEAEFVGIVGDKEAESKTITIKNLTSGEQETIKIEDAIKRLKTQMRVKNHKT